MDSACKKTQVLLPKTSMDTVGGDCTPPKVQKIQNVIIRGVLCGWEDD